MLYSYVNEKEEELKYESVNDFHVDDDPLKVIEEPVVNEQPVCEANIAEQVVNEVQDPCYIRWHIFDEIPERIFTIECEGYADKNGNPITYEELIKHLIYSELPVNIDAELEYYDENGEINYRDYDDYYYCMNHNRYDLRKITKQIRTKKFICEAPIVSCKSTAIRKWITSHSTERFIVIVPTVNIAEEFHAKLNKELSIPLC